MKLRSPILIRIVAAAMAFCVWCWMSTMRIRIHSLDGRVHPADPERQQFFYAFWHEGLLAPLTARIRIQMLISQHADGELIAQVCKWLGYGVVRGSTTRGGCEAIHSLVRAGKGKTHLGITPDGPKGPRRKLQMGLVWVASTTGMPIMPVGIGFTSAWRAKSWDQFAVPRLGSTLCGVLDEPIHVPPNLDRAQLEQWRVFVEERMLRVTELAESWAERIVADGQSAPAPKSEPYHKLRKSA